MRLLPLLACASLALCACGDKPAPTAAANPATSAPAKPQAGLEVLSHLPTGLQVKGTLDKILRWREADGEYLLVSSHGTHPEKIPEGGEEDWLFAAQYRVEGNQYKQLWQLNDSSGACPVEHLAAFYRQGIQVTDLDGNGQREVTLAYRLQCAGDPSAMRLKVVMHEHERKYALRGQTLDLLVENRAKAIPTECKPRKDDKEISYPDGCIESEAEFAAAPPPFLPYAKNIWRASLLENPARDNGS